MKILIPVLGFGKSGGYRVLSKLADELIELGNSVTFLSSYYSSKPYFPTKAEIAWFDTKSKRHLHPGLKAGSFLKHISSLRKGYKVLDAGRAYDVVFVSSPLVAYFTPSSMRKMVVYYSQAYEPDYYFRMGGIKNFLLGKIAERAYDLRFYTIVNAPVFENFKKLHSSRVLLPGIDFKIFHPETGVKPQKEKLIIGTVGRPEVYKGSDIIFDVFQTLAKEFANLEFRIAFCPQDITDKIPGAVAVVPNSDAELAAYYRSLDLYICAGNIHPGAFHYPVVEAMACGVPVVSTHYYLVNETNAFVVKMNDAGDLLNRIRDAIHNQQRCSENVRCALKDLSALSWESSGKKLLQYILEKDESKKTSES